MIVASFLLAQAVAAAPSEPPAESEIVVLAQRLAETRVDWTSRRRDGAIQIRRCRVTKSSDAGLDRVVCQAVRECAPHIPYDAPAGDTFTEFYACAERRSLELAQALLARRERRR